MMPLPMPEFLNLNYICESASRLLFLSMHWARSIPAFQALGWFFCFFSLLCSALPPLIFLVVFSYSVNLWILFFPPFINFFSFSFWRPENGITQIKACWNELFALGLAQCAQVMNVETILTAIVSHLQSSLEEGRTQFNAAPNFKWGILHFVLMK